MSIHSPKKSPKAAATAGEDLDDIMHSTVNLSPQMVQTFYEEAESGSIRRLPICGEKDASKPGYSTFEWHSKTTKSTSASRRSLATIQYWVGGSICALRMIMSDGTLSQKFGKFHPLDREQKLAFNDQIKYIVMRGDHEYVQAIKLINKDNDPIIDI